MIQLGFVLLSTARCCGCKTTYQHGSSIRCVSRAAHVHADPSLPRIWSRQTSGQSITRQEASTCVVSRAWYHNLRRWPIPTTAGGLSCHHAASTGAPHTGQSAATPSCSNEQRSPEEMCRAPFLRCLDSNCGLANSWPFSRMPVLSERLRKQILVPMLDVK